MSRIQSCSENLSGDAVMAAGKLAYYLFLLKLSSHQKKKATLAHICHRKQNQEGKKKGCAAKKYGICATSLQLHMCSTFFLYIATIRITTAMYMDQRVLHCSKSKLSTNKS